MIFALADAFMSACWQIVGATLESDRAKFEKVSSPFIRRDFDEVQPFVRPRPATDVIRKLIVNLYGRKPIPPSKRGHANPMEVKSVDDSPDRAWVAGFND